MVKKHKFCEKAGCMNRSRRKASSGRWYCEKHFKQYQKDIQWLNR